MLPVVLWTPLSPRHCDLETSKLSPELFRSFPSSSGTFTSGMSEGVVEGFGIEPRRNRQGGVALSHELVPALHLVVEWRLDVCGRRTTSTPSSEDDVGVSSLAVDMFSESPSSSSPFVHSHPTRRRSG